MVPCNNTDTAQSTVTVNSTVTLSQQQKGTTSSESLSRAPTPCEVISSANELLYSHYDFESSPSLASKRSCGISVDNDESFTSTPISAVGECFVAEISIV